MRDPRCAKFDSVRGERRRTRRVEARVTVGRSPGLAADPLAQLLFGRKSLMILPSGS